MAPLAHRRFGTPLLAMLLAGCATTGMPTAPDVPPALRPPAGQVAFLQARASGVQIYDCAVKSGQQQIYEWAFRAPEAALADGSGAPIGKHFAGPTWQATDGSSVVGEVKGRDAGPSATAIPWLLLSAKSVTGPGLLGPTTSIQRVATVGGIAPAESCAAANLGQVARVPYTATYFFWRMPP